MELKCRPVDLLGDGLRLAPQAPGRSPIVAQSHVKLWIIFR
jgi:hypothetical protein